ncbi:MAG: LTA synthase family protein [Gammaproteobacteria bacterium]|nr:LTA synthase family protein [Gammaproteobacteria bacterium]
MGVAAIRNRAGYAVVYLAPIAVAVSFNPAYAYWLVSGVAIAGLVAWLWSRGAWHRLSASIVNAATSFANLLLGASLYVQGVGFNEQFFYHLDGDTFAIARQAYPVVFFGAWIYWLATCVAPALLGRQSGERHLRTHLAALAGVVGLVAYAPLLSFAAFVVSRSATPAVPAPTIPSTVEIEPMALDDPKSLVLVFAESLEATYSRGDIFGDDLTPSLTALATRGVDFGNIHEVNNTGSTITGMVGAMCALPLRSAMPWEHVNSVLPNVDVPLPGEACLGDVLAAHGYRTVFMGGAPLSFAGKGKFLEAHGFAELHGGADFLPFLEDPDYRSGWGIYDDTLFEFANRRIDELAAEDVPFALVLLTLDTHHPSGLPSESCREPRGKGSEMEFAIRCSDRLLSGFIDDVLTRLDDVVIALFSDHLAHRNQLFATLKNHADARRLRFSVWGGDVEPIRVERPGTHYDVMPTLLDFLGFEDWRNHELGASLLRFGSPWFSEDRNATTAITQDLPKIRLAMGSHVVFEAKGPMIDVDGRRTLATNEGLDLSNAIFAMEFDADGEIAGFRDSASVDEFMMGAKGGIWIGVSTNDEFNARHVPDEAAKLAFFAGCFDTDGFVAGSLWWREELPVSAILDGCVSKDP